MPARYGEPPTVELRQLRYFVAIAEEGSVTAASAAVRVAQPSLSRQLRSFERQLGVALFDRVDGRLRLTVAGASLLPLARDLLLRADMLTDTARSLASGRLTHLRIAAPPTTITDLVAPFIATFDSEDPLPSVDPMRSAGLFESLELGSVDLVLAPLVPPERFAVRFVANFPIWLYVPPDDPLARRKRLSIAELEADRLLLLPQSFVQRELFEAAARQAGLALDQAREVSSPEVAQGLAAAGWGHAVVSDDSRFGLRGVRLLSANGDELTMPVHGAWTRGHFAARELSEIVERLSAFCAARYGE
jgi:DNA-binding transcriptional LysR family regulator